VIPVSSASSAGTEGKRSRLEAYLRRRYDEEGEFYFKSKFVAEEVDLSAREIGALVLAIRRSANDLEIEKWGYTSATTWHVVAAGAEAE
jgi:hypothetical protein